MSTAVTPQDLVFRPNTDVILRHLKSHFGDAMDGRFEITGRDPLTGKPGNRFARTFDVGDLEDAAQYAAEINAISGVNCYFTPALLAADAPPSGQRSADSNVVCTQFVWADLDDEGAAEKAMTLVKTMPAPSEITVTGRHPSLRVQMMWPVDEPLTDHDAIREANRLICEALGGDPSVVNPSRLMRLAGTVAWPAKEGRVAEMTEFTQNALLPYSIERLRRVFGGNQSAPALQPDIPAGSVVPPGLRDAYMRDTVLACFREWCGENGAAPTVDELYGIAWPQFSKGTGLPESDYERRKMETKISYMLRRFDRGALPGLPDLDSVVEDHKRRKNAVPPKGQVKPAHQKPKLVSFGDFIRDFKVPDYLIEGIVQRRYLYTLTAKTGDGKTAVALRIGIDVATGNPVGSRPVEPGRVLIMVGENADDVRARLIVMAATLDLDVEALPITLVEGPFDLQDTFECIREQIEQIGPVALIIVDTAAAFFQGDDDNNNVQAGEFARSQLRPLTTLPGGPAVIVPAHPTKGATRESLVPRGGGAFLNEVDGNLRLWSNGEGVTELHWAGKLRGPIFEPIQFALEPVTHDVLRDSKGRLMPTVMARALTDQEAERLRSTLRVDEDGVLDAMNEFPAGSLTDWCRFLGWVRPVTGEPQKSKIIRRLETLERDKLVRKVRDRWILTGLGENEAIRGSAGRAAARNIIASAEAKSRGNQEPAEDTDPGHMDAAEFNRRNHAPQPARRLKSFKKSAPKSAGRR